MSEMKLSVQERALARFVQTIEKEQKKSVVTDLARQKALGQAANAWIATLSEDERLKAFLQFEEAASAANAKKIATHPLRPIGVDAAQERARVKAEKPAS